jgi:hypothetical protein
MNTAPNELEWTADDTGSALEAKIKNLIDILREKPEGSAEYVAADAELDKLLDSSEDSTAVCAGIRVPARLAWRVIRAAALLTGSVRGNVWH